MVVMSGDDFAPTQCKYKNKGDNYNDDRPAQTQARTLMTVTAMLTAANIVLSMSIFSIPVPGDTYLNDVIIDTAALLLDPLAAFIVGGVGAFLGDDLLPRADVRIAGNARSSGDNSKPLRAQADQIQARPRGGNRRNPRRAYHGPRLHDSRALLSGHFHPPNTPYHQAPFEFLPGGRRRSRLHDSGLGRAGWTKLREDYFEVTECVLSFQ